jgi:hypothetical protein
LKIKVLDVSVIPKSEDSRGVCAEFSESDRCIMQAWLDEQVGEMYPEVLEKRKT